jgi:hypothetical protein
MSSALEVWSLRGRPLDTSDDIQCYLLEVCVTLKRDLSADGVGIAGSRSRLLASVEWQWPLPPDCTIHEFSAGPRAAILVITRGEPTFIPRPAGNAEPSLALSAAGFHVESTLNAFADASPDNAAFVSPLGSNEPK